MATSAISTGESAPTATTPTGTAPARPAPRRDAAWLLSGGVVQSGVAFGANLVLVRHVAPEGFGRFALELAGVGLVLSLASLRSGTRVIRARAGAEALDPTTRERFANAIFQETLFVGLAILALAAASGRLSALGGCLLLAVLVQHLQTNLKAFRERSMAYRELSVLETASHLSGHGLSVLLVLAGAGAAALYLREVTIAVVGLSGLAALRAIPTFRWRWLSLGEWIDQWRDARDVWLDGALEGGFARTLVLAAGALGGARGAGLFFQAHRLAVVPHQFLAPVAGRLALNRFSRSAGPAERRRGRRRLMALLAVPLAAAALGTWWLADPLVPWLLGERWRDATPLLVAMLGAVVGTSLFATLKMYLFAVRGARVLLGARLLQFAGLGLGLGVGSMVAPDSGVASVAWGLSTAFGLAVLWAWVGIRRLERESLAGRS